jgi:hypothetical protein
VLKSVPMWLSRCESLIPAANALIHLRPPLSFHIRQLGVLVHIFRSQRKVSVSRLPLDP